MKRNFRSLGGAAILSALAIAMAPASAGAETIRFDQYQQGGTLTGSGSTATGTNIIFEYISYDGDDNGTPEKTLYCGSSVIFGGTGTDTNCLLNFDTASNTFTVTATAGLYEIGTFAGFVGADPSFSGGAAVTGTTGTILSGTFLSGSFDGPGLQFSATGLDSKNQAMLDWFGAISTDFKFASTSIRADSNGNVTQADITNTTAPVPEPGLLTMFGLGLLGVGRKLARRRA
jgi:hypothetical protein